MGTDDGLIIMENNVPLSTFLVKSVTTAGGKKINGHDLLELLKGCRIRSMIKDSRSRVWISTWRSKGLYCYDHGTVTIYSKDDGILSDQVRSVCERDDGSILVVCNEGVNVIKDGIVTEGYDAKDGLDADECLSVCDAANGDIIVGTEGNGIFVIGDKGIRNISRKDGLKSDIIMRIISISLKINQKICGYSAATESTSCPRNFFS